MKKFFSLMMIAAAFAFAACGTEGPNDDPIEKTQLETPVVTIAETEAYGFTAQWEAVAGAESYTVNMKGKNYSTTELSYTFENLNPGEYTVRVKAVGEGYEDSAFGSATATLTGATEVDWFTQTVSLPEADNAEEGIFRYNTIEFTWKGTGVADLRYNLYEAASIEGIDNATIQADLASLGTDSGAIIDEINGNGFEAQFNGLSAETEYALCVEVTNTDGIIFFTISKITTEGFETPAETLAFVGTWEVSCHQIYTIDSSGNGVASAKEEKFEITVEASASRPDEVYVYNYTMLGPDAWPAIGQVYGNQLYLMNGVMLDQNADEGYYYYWLSWYDFGDGKVSPSIDSLPFAVVAIAEDGNTATHYNTFELQDGNGNPVAVTCHAADIFGVADNGSIYFLGIQSFPAVYRTGQMEWVKKDASASAKSLGFQPAFNALKSDVVVK